MIWAVCVSAPCRRWLGDGCCRAKYNTITTNVSCQCRNVAMWTHNQTVQIMRKRKDVSTSSIYTCYIFYKFILIGVFLLLHTSTFEHYIYYWRHIEKAENFKNHRCFLFSSFFFSSFLLSSSFFFSCSCFSCFFWFIHSCIQLASTIQRKLHRKYERCLIIL